MATKTKMIVITSDEDLIQQLSTNTHIICIDDQTSTKSSQDLLADFSEINSKIDQVYKRALHSSKSAKKSIGSICAVCSADALGFNYDVLTCGSCKTFFHRNARQDLEKLKCVTGENQCPIEYEVRRRCTRCRLTRCFAVGMKKDFLISKEELQLRKERLQQIRSRSTIPKSPNMLPDSNILSQSLNEIDQLMMNVNENTNLKEVEEVLFQTLSVEDWLAIENIRSAFFSTFQKERIDFTPDDFSDPSCTLITWSHCFSEIALRFIQFFRQLDEFEHLNSDDRFTLIKYNLFSIYPLTKCFDIGLINDYSLYNENKIVEDHVRYLTLWGASNDINQLFVNMVLSLVRLSEQDLTLIILLTTILIFTHGLSIYIKKNVCLSVCLSVRYAFRPCKS